MTIEEQALSLLARNVRLRRKELGLTQEDAAHAMHMAARHYQKLEAGEVNVTIRTLAKVAAAFDVTMHDLFAPKGKRA